MIISSLREYSENNENYIEVPLIFDPVIREDLNTDFKCVVRNTLSTQMLRTTVKEGMYQAACLMFCDFFLIYFLSGGGWLWESIFKSKFKQQTDFWKKDKVVL